MKKNIFINYSNLYTKLKFDKFSRKFSHFPKVFFYHGVENNILDHRVQCNQIRFDLFKQQIYYLIDNGFSIISIEEFENRFLENKFRGNEIILTFDDGYKNNKDVVFPFLSSLNIPFSIFISTRHIDESIRYPSYKIRSLVYYSDKKMLDLISLGKKININSIAEKIKAEKELIKYIKSESLSKVNSLISDLNNIHYSDFVDEIDSKFDSESPMSWQEVIFLHNHGVEIGSHCHDHILVHENQPSFEIQNQLIKSKSIISEKIGYCNYLAYPNGRKKDVSMNSINEAEIAGYNLAFSTDMKSIKYYDNKYFLPRYIVPQSINGFKFFVNNFLFDKLRRFS